MKNETETLKNEGEVCYGGTAKLPWGIIRQVEELDHNFDRNLLGNPLAHPRAHTALPIVRNKDGTLEEIATTGANHGAAAHLVAKSKKAPSARPIKDKIKERPAGQSGQLWRESSREPSRKRKRKSSVPRHIDLTRNLLVDNKSSRKRDEFIKMAMKLYPGPPITIFNDVDDKTAPDADFILVADSIVTEGVAELDLEVDGGCSCPESGCVDAEVCSCAEYDNGQTRFSYLPSGYLDVNNPVLECNMLCSCGIDCSNRVVQRGRSVELQLFYSALKGWGLRSPTKILGGTFVLTYPGEIITSEEAEQRERENKHSQRHTYIFDLDMLEEDNCYAVDAGRYGGLARFCNHSCDPNLEIVAVMEGRASQKIYKIALFACRDIEPNEELTFDYVSASAPDDETDSDIIELDSYIFNQRCYCGAATCRKYIWYRD